MKALLFDLGGVLVDIEFNLAFSKFEQMSKHSADEIKQRFQMDEMYKKHEIGQVDWGEYAQHLRSTFELDATDDEVVSGWNAIFKDQIGGTVDAIRRINRQIDCYVFSNSNPTHQKFWVNKYPNVVSLFNHVFVSSEIGVRKPDIPAFEAIAQATNTSLADFVFFDDTQENIEGALEAGLDAVLVSTPHDVLNKLENLNLI